MKPILKKYTHFELKHNYISLTTKQGKIIFFTVKLFPINTVHAFFNLSTPPPPPPPKKVQSWTFTPREQHKYVLKPTLVAWGQGLSSTSSGGKKRQFSLRIIGEGSLGDMQVSRVLNWRIWHECSFSCRMG